MQSKNSLYIYNVYSSLAVIWRSIFDSHVCFPRWLRCSAVVSRRTIGLWVINKHGGCPPWNNQKFKHRLQNFSCSRKCSTTKYLIWLVEKVLCWRKESNYKISLASVELGISSAREHERKTLENLNVGPRVAKFLPIQRRPPETVDMSMENDGRYKPFENSI